MPQLSLQFMQPLRPLDLREYHRLESIHVQLFEEDFPEQFDYESNRPLSGVPISVQIRELVRQNPTIRSFGINSKACDTWYTGFPHSRDEIDLALERIGDIGPHLRSLRLSGQVRFSPTAQKLWAPSLSNLRSLSLRNTDLGPLFFLSLPERLPQLRKLKIHYERSFISPEFEYEAVKTFLSTLSVTDLTLSGFSVEIIPYVARAYGSRLENFHFYQFGWCNLGSKAPHQSIALENDEYTETFAKSQRWMTSDLEALHSGLTGLRSLGLNLRKHQLIIVRPAPQVENDWHKWQVAKYKVQNVGEAQNTSSSDDIFIKTDVLDRLASCESLRRVHLLLPKDDYKVTDLNTMLTFQYILKTKKGASFEEMMISSPCHNWKISRAADDRALLTACHGGRKTSEEIWDLKAMLVCSRVERHGIGKPPSNFCWPEWE